MTFEAFDYNCNTRVQSSEVIVNRQQSTPFWVQRSQTLHIIYTLPGDPWKSVFVLPLPVWYGITIVRQSRLLDGVLSTRRH